MAPDPQNFIAAWHASDDTPGFFATHRADLSDETVVAMKDYLRSLRRADPQRALQLAESMFVLAEMTGKPMHRAWALIARGNVQMARGQYKQAIADYEAAHTICLAEHRPVEAARAYIGTIYCLQKLAAYDDALRYAAQIRPVLEEHGEWKLAAGVDSNAAGVHHVRGNFHEALALLERALHLLERAGAATQTDAIAPLFEQAELLYSLKRYRDAQESAERVRSIALANECHTDLARVNRFMAKIASARCQYTHALHLLHQAESAFDAAHLAKDVLYTRKAILECYLKLNRLQAVVDESNALIRGFQDLSLLNSAMQVMFLQVHAYTRLERYDEALQIVERALAFFAERNITDDQARLEELRAELLLGLQKLGEALLAAQHARTTWQAAGLHVDEARTKLLLARIFDSQGDPAHARHLSETSLQVAEREMLPELAFRAQQMLAHLSEEEQAYEQALQEYTACIETLERLRLNIAPELRSDFIEDKGTPYEAAVQLSLRGQETERAFELMERAKSRTLVETLASSGGLDVRIKVRRPEDAPLVRELERLREERNLHSAQLENSQQARKERLIDAPPSEALRRCERRIEELLVQLQVRSAAYAADAGILAGYNTRLPELQAQLDAETLLLEYFVARGEVLAWTVDRERVETHRHLADAAAVSTAQSGLRLALSTATMPAGQRVAQLHLSRLDTLLLQPLAERIAGFRRIMLVPHGGLHHLPFHALYDSRAQSYLLERHEISYLPCASLLPIAQARGRHCRIGSAAPDPLIIANSAGGELPCILDEAASVDRLMPGALFTEDAATLAAIHEHAPHHRLLHIAAHGRFRADEPLFSALQLAGGELTVLDIFNLDLCASLVTLSACETGTSAIRGGDELIGLARACLYAGAASLLLTLWRVDDRSTSTLIEGFYRALLAGKTKAAALRDAQLALMRDPHYAHPYYWAPFVLIGDNGRL